jgi:phage baseplate assembly protein W
VSNQPENPHFAPPFELAGSTRSFRTVEQDTDADLAGAIEVILRYRPGQREDLPEFGTPDASLREVTVDNGVPVEIRQAITAWEPRVDVAIEEGEGADPLIQRVVVNMRSPEDA